MHISARADYAVRAMLAIAASEERELVKANALAAAQKIPLSFLQGILLDLRRAGLLYSHRGVDGGYELARPAAETTVGDVLRAVDGGLATVRGRPATATAYHGVASGLSGVWTAVSTAIRDVVDRTTLADLLPGGPPDESRAAAGYELPPAGYELSPAGYELQPAGFTH